MKINYLYKENNIYIVEEFRDNTKQKTKKILCVCMCGLVFERSKYRYEGKILSCDDNYCEFSSPKNSIIGKRFGYFVIQKRSGPKMLLALCDCGRQFEVKNKFNIKNKNCQDPYCEFSSFLTPEQRIVHNIIVGIVQRCRNKNNLAYPRYGGRGIDICQEWYEDRSKFSDYLGPRPSPIHSVDRIDSDKGYEPGNVKWATPSEQEQNRKIRGVSIRFLQEMYNGVHVLGENYSKYDLELEISKMMEYCNEKGVSLEAWARKMIRSNNEFLRELKAENE